MKKFIILLAILLLTPLTTVEVASIEKPLKTDVLAVKNADKRVEALQNVLNSHSSPLAPYAKHYVESADKNGLDWRLLPAIAGLESSFGKRQLSGSHNSYGWGGGRIYFKSYEDGIDIIHKALREKYAARGATTVETIAPIYAESPTWAPRVRSFMNKFEAEYARLALHSLELTI